MSCDSELLYAYSREVDKLQVENGQLRIQLKECNNKNLNLCRVCKDRHINLDNNCPLER